MVVGVDSVQRVRRANRRFSTYSFHAVDVACHDVPASESFDAVVSMHALHGHPEPERA
jgi:Methyltransferase domain